MVLRLLSALVAIVFVVSSVTLAQDPLQLEKEAQKKAQTEAQKKEQTEAQKKAQTEAQKQGQKAESGPMKIYNCPAPCNFKVQSKNEQEVVDIAGAHLKRYHNMTLSEKEIKSKMKVEGTKEKSEPKKETAEPKKEKPKQ